MKIRRKLNKTSRALWIILLTGLCAPVWAIPASSIILRYVNEYEIPKNFVTLFIVFSVPVYIGAFSDQFVEWIGRPTLFEFGSHGLPVLPQEAQVGAHVGEGIVDLVGDSGREFTDSCEPARNHQTASKSL